MADPRFYRVSGPFTLEHLAKIAGAELVNSAVAGGIVIRDVAPLETAGADHISFLDNRKYVDVFVRSQAAACIVSQEYAGKAPSTMQVLVAKDPYRAYAIIAQEFYPVKAPTPGVAPTAYVDASAELAADCRIEPGAYIGAHAKIGPGVTIGPNAVIGAGVEIGAHTVIGANASIAFAIIGKHVLIYQGACIGQDGFGFAMGPQGHLKVPQLGRVLIGDHVEVGANCTIDRGAGPDTVIGAGCMIDNLVHIAHNVHLGRGCVLAGQVGISGSTQLGDFVACAGQVGLTGHLKIGHGARIAAQSGVMRDVAPGETVGGSPAVPMAEWLKQSALINRMVKRKPSQSKNEPGAA